MSSGTTYLLRNRKIATTENFELVGEGEDGWHFNQRLYSNKLRETGTKQRLQRWSRGVLVFVSAGGIVRQFAPLYKSEGPGQVSKSQFSVD